MTTHRNSSNRGQLPARDYPAQLAPWRRRRFYAWPGGGPYYDDDFELGSLDRRPCTCGGSSEGPEYGAAPGALIGSAASPAHEASFEELPAGELAEFLRGAPPLSAEAFAGEAGEAETEKRDGGGPDRGGCGVARPAIDK